MNPVPKTKSVGRAVTLVELLIVMVVLAIIAAVAMPMLGETDSTRLAAAAGLLVADLEYAQLESIHHVETPRGLRLDANTESYTVVEQVGASFDCATAEPLLDPVTGDQLIVTFGSGRASQLQGVTIEDGYDLGGDECLVFLSLGELDQVTDATVTLALGGAQLQITVDAVSGEVSVSVP